MVPKTRFRPCRILSHTLHLDVISNNEIRAGYKSDHSVLYILINNFESGKGVWKHNIDLLKEESYLNFAKERILDEKGNIQYMTLWNF